MTSDHTGKSQGDPPGPDGPRPDVADDFIKSVLARGAAAVRSGPEAMGAFADSDDAKAAQLILDLREAQQRFRESRDLGEEGDER